MHFTDKDYWKGIILYGLNNATYKIALGKTLLSLASHDQHVIPWETLSSVYLDQYIDRLKEEAKPQQTNPARITVMERIIMGIKNESLSYEQAVSEVAQNGFNDVIPRFQTIGTDKKIAKDKFYEIDFGKKIILKDALLSIAEESNDELLDEIQARWGLLEGAFEISHGQQYQLANDIRDIYIKNGSERKNLTTNIPFLNGYQANTCFYCSEPMVPSDIHVDHVLPRQVIYHDEIWNLVLCHSTCNLSKSDHLVGKDYLEKLIARNENIMGSNHPWKHKIQRDLGNTPRARSIALKGHYDNVHTVLGNYYWGGIENYRPDKDPFYRSLITQLNHR